MVLDWMEWSNRWTRRLQLQGSWLGQVGVVRLRDGEARGHITNLRLLRPKRGASVFWRVQREVRRHSDEANSEKFLRGGGLSEMPR